MPCHPPPPPGVPPPPMACCPPPRSGRDVGGGGGQYFGNPPPPPLAMTLWRTLLGYSVNRSVKVRTFSGANINQMYYYVTPLLKKEPKVIILHIGTNDAVTKTSDTILDDILKLKFHIESQLIGVEVVISCPINRIDNSKARLTIKHVINKIKLIKVTKIMNENISDICLERKGLHLNLRGNGRLTVNLITLMRKL